MSFWKSVNMKYKLILIIEIKFYWLKLTFTLTSVRNRQVISHWKRPKDLKNKKKRLTPCLKIPPVNTDNIFLILTAKFA